MSFRKRVKFSDLDVDIPLSCRRNSSSTPLEGRRGPRCKFLLLCFSGAAYCLCSRFSLLFSFFLNVSLCAKCLIFTSSIVVIMLCF
jgi:hypothetical protein